MSGKDCNGLCTPYPARAVDCSPGRPEPRYVQGFCFWGILNSIQIKTAADASHSDPNPESRRTLPRSVSNWAAESQRRVAPDREVFSIGQSRVNVASHRSASGFFLVSSQLN